LAGRVMRLTRPLPSPTASNALPWTHRSAQFATWDERWDLPERRVCLTRSPSAIILA